jgi:hypothetical protein
MPLDGRQSKPVILPSRQIFGAVDSHTAALGVTLDFVFSKEPEFPGALIIVDPASMCVYQIPVGIVPLGSRHNIGRRSE